MFLSNCNFFFSHLLITLHRQAFVTHTFLEQILINYYNFIYITNCIMSHTILITSNGENNQSKSFSDT